MSAPLSLRWKVAAAVSVLLLAVGTVTAWALLRYERLHLTAEGEKRAVALAQTLAVAARDPLLEADELRLGPVIQAIVEDPDAILAYVVNHEGTIAYHSDTQLIGTPVRPLGAKSRAPLLTAEVPVVIEDTMVGTATVALSAAFVDRAVRTTGGALLLRLGLGLVLGLGGVLFLTDHHLRRIIRLEHAVGRLGDGDLGVRAQVQGRDELARLGRGFNSMVAQLERARAEIEVGVTETVSALASTLEVKDAYTHGHCERVARGTIYVARRLGVEESKLRDFELAALLHDIGKIGVPNRILAKKGRLTADETTAMREHAALGARILASLSFLDEVARIVRHHHEDWDGNGYPDRLAGEAIPLAARIIHVIDGYDAMTSSRPYRKALSHQEAVRRLLAGRGTQFAPAIVDVFLQAVEEGAIGSIRRQVDGGVAA